MKCAPDDRLGAAIQPSKAGLLRRSHQLRLLRDNGIANMDVAAGDHLGIDSAIGVPQAAHQCLRYIEVTRRTFGIDVGLVGAYVGQFFSTVRRQGGSYGNRRQD